MRGLNCKVAADIREYKAATAKDTFNVDGVAYGTDVFSVCHLA